MSMDHRKNPPATGGLGPAGAATDEEADELGVEVPIELLIDDEDEDQQAVSDAALAEFRKQEAGLGERLLGSEL